MEKSSWFRLGRWGVSPGASTAVVVTSVVVSVLAIFAGCASVGGAGDGDAAAGEDAAMRALAQPKRYSPWPVAVDRGFRDGAILTTSWIAFSHPAGWYFRPTTATAPATTTATAAGATGSAGSAGSAASAGASTGELNVQVLIDRTTSFAEADTGRKLSALGGGGQLVGRVIAAPWEGGSDAPPSTRFLQWVAGTRGDSAAADSPATDAAAGAVAETNGTVVWSDESVTAPAAGGGEPRPLFLALLQHGPASDERLHAIAWQQLADREVVVELIGPAAAIRDTFPDMIRLAKTVGPGVGAGAVIDGSPGTDGAPDTDGAPTETAPAAGATRRLPGGLQFSDPTGTWRWSADLADGFVVTSSAPPRLHIAVWQDDDAVRFQAVSPADVGAATSDTAAESDGAPGSGASGSGDLVPPDAATTDPRVATLLRDAIALRATEGDRR